MSDQPQPYEASTALPDGAQPPTALPTDTPVPAQPSASTLKSNEVRLSTGMVIGLRRTSRADDRRIESVLGERGDSMIGMGMLTLQYSKALGAISTVDGKPADFINTPVALDAAEMSYFSDDTELIYQKWAELNGGRNKAGFPQSGVAAGA